jgi:N-ethylmaleimide reductase
MTSAFDGTTIGRYTTRNRVVMAPMTRSRAYGPGASPTGSWPPTTVSAPARA